MRCIVLVVTISILMALFWSRAPPFGVTYPDIEQLVDVEFDGPLAANDKLETVKQLFKGQLKGPESFAVGGEYIYTGVHGAEIVEIDIKREVIIRRIKYGPCKDHPRPIAQHRELECGRPLGLEFDASGDLIIADSSLGLLRMNIKDGTTSSMVSNSEVIANDKGELKSNLITNSVTIPKKMGTGATIYYTTSSTKVPLPESYIEFLTEPSGRALAYDVSTGTSKVLMEKLRFANGIALSMDEQFVIVCETATGKLWKHTMSTGTTEMFANMPGYPDNVRLGIDGNFLVGVVLPHHPRKFIFVTFITSRTWLRQFVAKTLGSIHGMARWLSFIPPIREVCERITYWTLNLELPRGIAPMYGLIVEVDVKGTILRSWHSPSGKHNSYSEGIKVRVGETDYLLLGSPYNDYIGKVEY